MDSQLNEPRKEEKNNNHPNRYNPRSKRKERKLEFSDQPTRAGNFSKDVADNSKEKEAQTPAPMVKIPILEVK